MPDPHAPPLVLILAVGLTERLLPLAPRLSAIAGRGWSRPLAEAVPAVTCTAQATMLTGAWPDRHGIVANGWLYRDTREVRFWQQANSLLQAEPVYETARRRAADRGRPFKTAKLFWWFNQGAPVEWFATPKPHYGADGSKVFGIMRLSWGFTYPWFTDWRYAVRIAYSFHRSLPYACPITLMGSCPGARIDVPSASSGAPARAMVSRHPIVSVVTTGLAVAIASSTERGNPS